MVHVLPYLDGLVICIQVNYSRDLNVSTKGIKLMRRVDRVRCSSQFTM